MRNLSKLINTQNAIRIQKSVFEIAGTDSEVQLFYQKVLLLVKENEDKVALIPICEEDAQKTEIYGIITRKVNVLPKYYLL
jgi:CRISPR-associated endonuclease Cas2